jgi:hypothetical protein
MGYVLHLIYDYPILAAALLGFTVWMTVDVHRRGVEPFWYWIIWIVPIAGPFIYFFTHPGPDWATRIGPLFQPKVALAELRHRAQQSPTLANQLALAQALIGRKEYDEALPYLESARKIEPDHGQVLYGIAVCQARSGRLEQAIPLLEAILKKDPRWGDDQAGVLLVEVHAEREDLATALIKARELVQLAPTLKHKCLLAEILIDHGQRGEARTLLDDALRDHYYLPGPLKRRHRAWAGKARSILRGLR